MKIAYSHLVQHIPENPTIEQISDSLFQLGHEHEIEDDIFDMEFTPNRGDCLSIKGLLRDLAVFYTIDFNQEIYNEELPELKIDFENHSENICPQISFLKLEIDKIPETYKNSLADYFCALSINKNNFFTDVSNYLSYETGQPTHCYDANNINNKLIFHETESNEDFETLLDKKITLKSKNAVFSMNNKVINLAGVVGGKNTSCSVDTKIVIVECAYFKPEAIIGKSLLYDIHSDASHKFERGVDQDCQDSVLRRFIQVVSEHTSIKDMSIISHIYKQNKTIEIPVNVKKINQIVGINLTENDYKYYLSKLGFVIDRSLIKVPSFRNDIKTQNDLAEEIARVIGYDNIKREGINIPRNSINNNGDIENKLRHYLLDNGFYEVINPPFIGTASKDAIKVDNPLDSNRQFLRTNTTSSLLDNLLYNERRQKDSVKLFEITNIYTKNNRNDNEKRVLGIIASGRIGENYIEFSQKINKEYISSIVNKYINCSENDVKIISRENLNSKSKNQIIYIEVELSSINPDILKYESISRPNIDFVSIKEISDYPCSKRDLSFSITKQSNAKVLEDILLSKKTKHLKKVFIFDYYKNHNIPAIKIGFRFIFESNIRTLKDFEVDQEISEIIENVINIDGISIQGLNT